MTGTLTLVIIEGQATHLLGRPVRAILDNGPFGQELNLRARDDAGQYTICNVSLEDGALMRTIGDFRESYLVPAVHGLRERMRTNGTKGHAMTNEETLQNHEQRIRAIEGQLTAAERIAVLLAEQKIAEAEAWEAHRAGTLGVLHDSEPGTVTDAAPNAPR